MSQVVGARVTEFAFTAASVGRIALSLHQAMRNHRIALPDDDVLTDELVSVRLRKNSIGVLRLDHDAGRHDDQAIALALGTYHLLDQGDNGAEAWIAWARQQAIEAGAAVDDVTEDEEFALRKAGSRRELVAALAVAPGAVIEGVIVDPVLARKTARDAVYQAIRGVW